MPINTEVCSIEAISPTTLQAVLKPEFDGRIVLSDGVEIQRDADGELAFSYQGHTLPCDGVCRSAKFLGEKLLIPTLPVSRLRAYSSVVYCDLNELATESTVLLLTLSRMLYAAWCFNKPQRRKSQQRAVLLDRRSAWGVR